MIIFDSRKDDMDCQVKKISKDCRIVKYNSLYRLIYHKLEMVIGNFEIYNYLGGVYINLYDVSGNSNGVVEVKGGGWIY